MKVELLGVEAGFGKSPVLHGIDLTINSGAMVAVVGPNGSGKSTLLRTVAGLIRPSGGRIFVGGRDLHAIPRRQRASVIGLLTQNAERPDMMTVEEHVRIGLFAARSRFSAWTSGDTARVSHAMEAAEVSALSSRRLNELSGGEFQRVRLATVLAQNPAVLLLDEPLTGLDIQHQLDLLALLHEIREPTLRTTVCVLHDLDLAFRHFEHIVLVSHGRIESEGPPVSALSKEQLGVTFGITSGTGPHFAGGRQLQFARAR